MSISHPAVHTREDFTDVHKNFLKHGLIQISGHSDDTVIERFHMHYTLLQKWNATHNLTRIITPKAVCRKHYFDSLAPLLVNEVHTLFFPGARVFDLGSGAGLPGIPLKLLMPHIHLTMIDAKEKVIAFLNKLVILLNLTETQIRHAAVGHNHVPEEEKADIVVARAFGQFERFYICAGNLLKPGGMGIYYGGKNIPAKLPDTIQLYPVTVPYLHQERTLLVFKQQA